MVDLIHIRFAGEFKPGDPEPDGFLEWHEWAEVQHQAGLRQTLCPSCRHWMWPGGCKNCEAAGRATATTPGEGSDG